MSGESRKSALVGRARRLSAASDLSSYSVVSGAPTVYSIDTNESLDGGVIVTPPAEEELEIGLSALTIKDPVVGTAADFTRSNAASNDTLEAKIASYKPAPNPSTSAVSDFWLQFVGFEPNPTATFKAEFARLAAHQDWATPTKRERQVEALTAEVAFHYGTCMDKLSHWQQLCEDVGIEDVPSSITKCKKTLRPVLVNLYNLIDHCRNPDIAVLRFKSYMAFCRYTRGGRTFPKACAKQDGFIRVLLKKM
ncbi:hypothetical protein FB567DRAFT_559904 [Paraphoma chrysanthemicola]|uniref:Uncharacterized protein n=1 Tax=Paraphoma chrysanthemicola TaxID=798071 RepID=A0A8K0VYR7_9PLEO|nr:hypothetical protein FB567DRAFT_559904 [Paraphoma chrysanthemicola]